MSPEELAEREIVERAEYLMRAPIGSDAYHDGVWIRSLLDRVTQQRDALRRVEELCHCGVADPDHGCCSACRGAGTSNDPITGGRCADCYGTGHSHGPAECEPDFIAAIQRAACLSLSTEGATDE